MKTSLGLILGVAAIGGCGDSVSTGQVDQFIQTMAQQSCDWEFRCCTDPEIASLDGSKFTTQDRCNQYRALALEDQLYIDRLAVKEGRLRVDNTKATACLAQLSSKLCNPDPTKPMQMPTNPMAIDACANVFVGKTPIGSECIYANECVTGAHCVSDQLAVGRGVCVPFQKVGDICNDVSDCDPTVAQIYCAAKDFTCRVRGTLGQPCAYTTDASGLNPSLPLLLECDTSQINLYCDPVSKSCKALPQAGEACLDPPPPGVADSCDPNPTLNLQCDQSGTGTGATATCRAPGKAGDDCSQFACGMGLYCDRSTANQVCTALPGLGQPCQVSGDLCAMAYFCNFAKSPAVCDQPAQLGQDCSQVNCDLGLFCDRSNFQNELCKTQLPDGSLCTSADQCLSQQCFATGTATTETCQPKAVTVQCIGR